MFILSGPWDVDYYLLLLLLLSFVFSFNFLTLPAFANAKMANMHFLCRLVIRIRQIAKLLGILLDDLESRTTKYC